MTATFNETRNQFDDRFRQSILIRENIDESKSDEEIARIRAARERKISDLMQAERYASNPEDVPMMRNRMNAVKIGLPENTAPEIIQETRARLFRQSNAVLRGLDKNATQEEIDAAGPRVL